MQWLDLRSTRKYLKWDEQTLSETSLGKIAKAIVNAYNEKHQNETFKKHKCDFEDPQYKLKVYARPMSIRSSLVRDLSDKGVTDLENRTGNEILLFFCPVMREKDIVILSSDQSWRVVRACVNHAYPIKIAERILDPTKVVEIVRRCLIGPNLKETILHPASGELLKTTSLYYFVESFKSVVKTHASVMNFLPFARKFEKGGGEPTVKITAGGLLRIERRLGLEDYPVLFNLFYDYTHDMETYSQEGKLEERDPQFEFLHFVQPAQASHEELNARLVEDIFKAFTEGRPLPASFRHKLLNEFYGSDIFAIQVKKKGHFKDLPPRPPTLQEILEMIREHREFSDHGSLYTILCEGQIRFSSKEIEESLIRCIEAELRYEEHTYFKLRGTWFQITSDFNALLLEDFRTILRQKLLRGDAEGQLPNPWKGNKPQNLLKEPDVKAIRGDGKGIRKFMEELEAATMCFVSPEGQVNQARLVGEILSVQIIKDNKEAIEEELASADSKPLAARLKKRFLQESKDILDELKEERKLVEVVEKGDKKKEKRVINPVSYPLKHLLKDKEDDFQALLERLCDNQDTQDEAAYNRTYLFDQMNQGKPFGERQGYLVFDRVLPNNIEPCDIVYYTPKTTRLYHVKEDFGQHTREAVSQILTAAKALRASLSTQQPQDFLEMLWNKSMKTEKKEGWRALVKQQLETLGKKNFFKIFFERKIVFVYAYLVKPGHSLHAEIARDTYVSPHHLKSTPDSSQTLQELENNGYIDSRWRRLTGKFYESTQETFSLEGAMQEHSQQVFADLQHLKPVSASTLAKLEIIHLARELQALNFELEICEIQRPDTTVPSQAPSLPEMPSEEDSPLEEEAPLEQESPITQEVVVGLSGLDNIGNSCYINATLQALHFLKPIQAQIEQHKGNKVVKSIVEVLKKRNRKTLAEFRDMIFKSEIEGALKGNKYGQHDAHELLVLLFNSMQWFPFKTYTYFSYNLPSIDGKKSHLSVQIPSHHLSIGLSEGQSLQASIRSYFQSEAIDDPTDPLKPEINGKVYRVKKYSRAERIAELPEILVVHLKRFDNSLRKVTYSIPFPEGGMITIQQRLKDPITTYKIVSIINHHGPSIKAGHYTANIKDLTTEDEPWIHCNDSQVVRHEPINPETEAYIVFLLRESEVQPDLGS